MGKHGFTDGKTIQASLGETPPPALKCIADKGLCLSQVFLNCSSFCLGLLIILIIDQPCLFAIT